MLDAAIAAQLKNYLGNLKRPIELIASLDDGTKSHEVRELPQEIATMSGLVTFIEKNDNDRKPFFLDIQLDGLENIPFAGIPIRHEFTSLMLALFHTGGHPVKIEADVIEQVIALDGPFEFETYISLSCQNCSEEIQALKVLLVLNLNINHNMIDDALCEDEIDKRQIMAVPTVYLNGQVFGQGHMSLPEVIAKLDTGAIKPEAAKLGKKQSFDVLIIVGGAGATTSIYAPRKDFRTGIFAQRFDGQVMDTMAIENFISIKETEGPKLVALLEEHVKEYDVDVINLQRADTLTVNGKLFDLESGATLSSRAVILATGARWREMNVPGESEYRNQGVACCPHCNGTLFKGKQVDVIGGGNSGVEATIDLAELVAHVTLLEYADKLGADVILQKKLLSLNNITVITNAQTTEVVGDGYKVTGLKYKACTNDDMHHIELSQYGEIEVDSHVMTSIAGVFAAGDDAKEALGSFDYLIRN